MSEAFDLMVSTTTPQEVFLDEAKAVSDAVRLLRGSGRTPDVQYSSENEPFGEWRRKAACLDLDPNLFFPAGEGLAAQEQAKKAKKICGSCAVQAQCLDFAVTTKQESGIWGGKTEAEIKSLLRANARSKRTKQ